MTILPDFLQRLSRREQPTPQGQVHLGLLTLSGLLASGSLFDLFGPLGIAVALGSVGVGWRLNAVGGIVILHAAVVLTDGLPSVFTLILLESASVLLLTADFQSLQGWSPSVAVGGLALLSGSSILLLTQSFGLVVSLVGIVASASILLYTGHRYEQYQLGLLNDDQ